MDGLVKQRTLMKAGLKWSVLEPIEYTYIELTLERRR